MKRVKLLSIIAILCASVSSTWAQTVTLASWGFTSVTGGASDPGASPFAPLSSDPNLTIVGLTRGAGVPAPTNAAANAWGGQGFNDGVATASQTKTTAINNNNFVTFSVTANSGYSTSFTNIAAYNIRKSGTGPAAMLWQYSLDGTNFTDLTAQLTTGGNTSGTGNDMAAVPLSTVAGLQSVTAGTTVTFRALIYGATADAGTWYFNGAGNTVANRTLSVNGVVNTSAPLPLNLISFKGTQEQSVNHLAWVTSQEKYITRFELERATDGINFSKIAEINSAVKSDNNANNNYSYDDNNAAATTFYRLKIVEVNGTANYSDIVVLRKGAQQAKLKLYPNPADGTLFIEGLKGASSYQVTDAMGRVVLVNSSFNSDATTVKAVDVSGLIVGIYFVQIKDENGSETIRFVKK